MASPLAHVAAAAAIVRLLERRVGPGSTADPPPTDGRSFDLQMLAAAAWALLPDLDFLPGLVIGAPARFHQEATHSLLFAVVAGCLGGLLVGPLCGRRLRRPIGTLTLATASHLLLDYLVLDQRPPVGIPLFWPFSAERFESPVPLLLGIRHALTADASISAWLSGIFSPQNLLAVALEAVWIGVVVGAVWLVRASRRSTRGRSTG